jgi:hypothetical protein
MLHKCFHCDRRRGNILEDANVLFAVVLFGSTLLSLHLAQAGCTCYTERRRLRERQDRRCDRLRGGGEPDKTTEK